MMPAVWQIGCGEEDGRDYRRLFLDHDVMLLGPGRYGRYNPSQYEHGDAKRDFPERKIGMIRAFAEQVKEGDVIIARLGTRAVAVGIATGRYEHRAMFDDVYGWDLQHTWRVRWFHQPSRPPKRFSNPRGAAFSRVNVPKVEAWARKIARPIPRGPLKKLPPEPTARMTRSQLVSSLQSAKLDRRRSASVACGIEQAVHLLSWYSEGQPRERRQRPSEYEIVGHVVVPIMRALGWEANCLAIEWNRIDLAAFSRPGERPSDCQIVCEAKRKGRPLGTVLRQAKRYCGTHRLVNCRTIFITDGEVFYMYRRLGGHWEPEPSGYINLTKVRRRNLIPRNSDAVKTLMALMPSKVGK